MRRHVTTSLAGWLLWAGIALAQDPPAPGSAADDTALQNLQTELQRTAATMLALQNPQAKPAQASETERLQKQVELLQKQVKVLNKMTQLLAEQIKKRPPAEGATE